MTIAPRSACAAFLRKGIMLCALVLLAAGCARRPAQSLQTAEHLFKRGTKLMAKKDYVAAKEVFERIISGFPGSDWVDDAQFGLAEAYYRSDDYVSAAYEYERIREDLPLSPLVDDAQFKLAMCYFQQSPRAELDQESTYQAMAEFARFIEDYPQSPLVEDAGQKIRACRAKLARKDYLNGQFYLKSGNYAGALVYFGGVLRNYGDTQWASRAQFGIGEALFRQESYTEALAAYEQLASSEAPESLKNRAERRIAQIRGSQDRGSGQ